MNEIFWKLKLSAKGPKNRKIRAFNLHELIVKTSCWWTQTKIFKIFAVKFFFSSQKHILFWLWKNVWNFRINVTRNCVCKSKSTKRCVRNSREKVKNFINEINWKFELSAKCVKTFKIFGFKIKFVKHTKDDQILFRGLWKSGWNFLRNLTECDFCKSKSPKKCPSIFF